MFLKKPGLQHATNPFWLSFTNNILISYLIKGWWNLFALQKQGLYVTQAAPAAKGLVLPETHGV